MDFEWDEAKRQSNLVKQGVDLLDAALIFEGPVIMRPDDRRDYGEERYRAIGLVGDDCFEVVFTWRGDNIRLIAAWKGGQRVRRDYQAGLARRHQGDEGPGRTADEG